MRGRAQPLSRATFPLPSVSCVSRRALGVCTLERCSPGQHVYSCCGSKVLGGLTSRGFPLRAEFENPSQARGACFATLAAAQVPAPEVSCDGRVATELKLRCLDTPPQRGENADLDTGQEETFAGPPLLDPRPSHIPEFVWDGLKRGLHRRADNPVGIVVALLRQFFQSAETGSSLFSPEVSLSALQSVQPESSRGFLFLDAFSPVVSARENFDWLLFDASHPSRSGRDTYYLEQTVLRSADALLLRTHATAHQTQLLRLGVNRAVWAAGVARRDEVDKRHFPVFHQADAFRIFDPSEEAGGESELERLRREHAALLRALELRMHLQDFADSAPEKEQVQQCRVALETEAAAAGLSVHQLDILSGFACLASRNIYRDNAVVLHLQVTVERLMRFLFLKATAQQRPEESLEKSLSSDPALASSLPRLRWVYDDSYFPFTEPSLELDVLHEGQWLEVLGAGEIRNEIIKRAATDPTHDEFLISSSAVTDYVRGQQIRQRQPPTKLVSNSRGWALGVGVERLCFLLFDIPDIRLLWSRDRRFTRQFADGKVKQFVPFSHMPPVFKDISFWTTPTKQSTDTPLSSSFKTLVAAARRGEAAAFADLGFDLPRFFEICREEGGGWIEDIETRDVYVHPKHERVGLCFRLTFKSLERTLTHVEVNDRQRNILERLKKEMSLEIR